MPKTSSFQLSSKWYNIETNPSFPIFFLFEVSRCEVTIWTRGINLNDRNIRAAKNTRGEISARQKFRTVKFPRGEIPARGIFCDEITAHVSEMLRRYSQLQASKDIKIHLRKIRKNYQADRESNGMPKTSTRNTFPFKHARDILINDGLWQSIQKTT